MMIDSEDIEKANQLIVESDAILIGAGAGLSIAAGIAYSGTRFTNNFADYIERYKLTDMYSASFYPFHTLEEKWGYFSRHIKFNRFDAKIGKVYTDILNLVKDKNYFVITTNVDSQFFRAGFHSQRVFATQGDYGKFQCKIACHDELYDNEDVITQMVEKQADCHIPSSLVPYCPVCGGNMVSHLRIDANFIENADWKKTRERYVNFIQQSLGKQFVLLELGVGFNTPGIIRWPMEQIAMNYEKSALIRVNKEHVQPTYDIQDKSLLIENDITEFIEKLTH